MQREQTVEKIDLELLPEEARKELIDFYESLVEKYGIIKQEKQSKIEALSRFAGILKLPIDPLKYQKTMRDEWD